MNLYNQQDIKYWQLKSNTIINYPKKIKVYNLELNKSVQYHCLTSH